MSPLSAQASRVNYHCRPPLLLLFVCAICPKMSTSFQEPLPMRSRHHSNEVQLFKQACRTFVSTHSRPHTTTTTTITTTSGIITTAENRMPTRAGVATCAAATAATAGIGGEEATEPPSPTTTASLRARLSSREDNPQIDTKIPTRGPASSSTSSTGQAPRPHGCSPVPHDSGAFSSSMSRTNDHAAVGTERDPRAAEGAVGSPASSTAIVPRSLDSVRSSLIRQEETIIFSLIEREQFRQNSVIYTDRTFRLQKDSTQDVFDRDSSFLEYMLCETEKLHAKVRRYMNFEELAFFPMFLPESILAPLNDAQLLAPNCVNMNHEILSRYISEVVPAICEPGDDGQHGSSIVCDVSALQAISRRVHLGKFVAESKFQKDSMLYHDLCRAGDAVGVNKLLTNKAVEQKVLHRAYIKASTYGRDIGGVEEDEEVSPQFKVEPEVIMNLYRRLVIPLTKDVEILYLFERTGYACPSLDGIHDL